MSFITLLMVFLLPDELTLERAKESLCRVEMGFWNPDEQRYSLYADAFSPSAHLWDTGIVLAAYAAWAKLDQTMAMAKIDLWLLSHEDYWLEAGPVSGYNPGPDSTKVDRYYDDNAWVALALMEAYEHTQHGRYLDQALKVHYFVMSGEDDKLGGGIYWHETKQTKNTCSNANTAVTAYKLYRATKDHRFRAQGDRILEWIEKLRAPNGLYWDHIQLDGKIEKTLWSYNAALPIRAWLERYRITDDPADLNQAVRTARAARVQWMDKETGHIRCDASFAHHLTDAWIELEAFHHRGKWAESARQALTSAWELTQNEKGFFGPRWDRPFAEPRSQLLWSASVARGWASLAAAQPR